MNQVAPWIGSDLARMLDIAIVGRGQWDARTLGDRFEVTAEEKLNYDLRNIEAFDTNRGDVQEAIEIRRRERDRIRKADKRQQEARRKCLRAVSAIKPASNTMPISDFAVAHRQVYAYLAGKGWQTIRDLAVAFRNDTVIGCDPTGRRLGHKALTWKLHRWATDLVEGGLVAEDFIPFHHGKRRRVRRFDEAV